MMLHIPVFWIVTPFRVVVGYQRFGGPCCLHQHHTASQSRRPRLEA